LHVFTEVEGSLIYALRLMLYTFFNNSPNNSICMVAVATTSDLKGQKGNKIKFKKSTQSQMEFYFWRCYKIKEQKINLRVKICNSYSLINNFPLFISSNMFQKYF